MQLIVPGVIVLAILLGWGCVELDHVIHAYPGQFWVGALGFAFLITAAAGLRHRLAARPLPPPYKPALPKAVRAVPVKPEIAAAPPAPPLLPPVAPGARCEGPACAELAGDDPWSAKVPGEQGEHLFCSRECAQEWHAEFQAARHGG